ncbi:hypothetical protein OPQ81_010330 [Rhizoctonia solani]|nr:hypothetical protein OPQ81_010330 [Rhizoctonia solani]
MFQPQQSIGAVPAGGEIGSTFLPSSEPTPFTAGTRAPPERAGTKRRKKALLALLDELTAFREEEIEMERGIRYTVTKDEQIPSNAEGIGKFHAFDERIRSLDLKLQVFTNAIRQLGSSGGLASAAYHLRARFGQIQYFFRENAADLFNAIPHAPNIGTQRYSARKRAQARGGMAVGPAHSKPWSTEIEELPDEMEKLAKDLDVFLKRLNYILEFTDQVINLNTSITVFQADLRYRASCLREFKGQMEFSAVSRYINDITEDFLVHMESMVNLLDNLIEVSVPLTRSSQENYTTRLQNLSTVVFPTFSAL